MKSRKKMSFLEHLEELRRRLIISAVAVLVGMVICWFFREEILAFLLDPLYHAWRQVDGLDDPEPLNFSSMLEPFVAYLKLSALGGVFLSAPVILYQLWLFISPGLYKRERRLAFPFVFVSSVLFVGGSIMAYSVVFPIGFRFFLDFAVGQEMTTLEAEVEWEQPTHSNMKDISANKESRPVRSLDNIDAGVNDAGPVDPDLDERLNHLASPQTQSVSSDKKDTRSYEAQRQTWYEAMFGKMFGQDCGRFYVKPGEKEKRVILEFEWYKTKCGEVASLIKVKRNNEEITPQWSEESDGREGYISLFAEDSIGGKSEYKYSLAFPTNNSGKKLAPMLMVKDYLSFAIRLILAFGLIFELPILIVFLSLAGIVNYKQLLRFSRYFFVIAVVVSAMLTPPDVVTQLLLATPLMILYMVSVLVSYFLRPKQD